MRKQSLVYNVSRGQSFKHKYAERAVEACSGAWVEYGVSFRDLTLAESISARNEQARLRDPLPYAEIFGLSFEPPIGGEAAMRQEAKLTWMAYSFATKVGSAA